MSAKAVGRRYWLRDGIVAEVYDSGTVILAAGDTREFYDRHGKHNAAVDDPRPLWAELGRPESIREFVELHGRPHGMLWREE